MVDGSNPVRTGTDHRVVAVIGRLRDVLAEVYGKNYSFMVFGNDRALAATTKNEGNTSVKELDSRKMWGKTYIVED